VRVMQGAAPHCFRTNRQKLAKFKNRPVERAKNEQILGSNKRLAIWLDTFGLDGRKTTQPLAGVYELRLGDAHIKGGGLRTSLALFNIPPDNSDYQTMCCEIIGQVANCIHAVVKAIPKK
jgi:hypothetical protein